MESPATFNSSIHSFIHSVIRSLARSLRKRPRGRGRGQRIQKPPSARRMICMVQRAPVLGGWGGDAPCFSRARARSLVELGQISVHCSTIDVPSRLILTIGKWSD